MLRLDRTGTGTRWRNVDEPLDLRRPHAKSAHAICGADDTKTDRPQLTSVAYRTVEEKTIPRICQSLPKPEFELWFG